MLTGLERKVVKQAMLDQGPNLTFETYKIKCKKTNLIIELYSSCKSTVKNQCDMILKEKREK